MRLLVMGFAFISVLLAVFALGSTASAQQGIGTQTLVEQRVEVLPEGPLCWDVRRGSLTSGSATPATGFHVHGWVVAYITDGSERFEYQDGRTGTFGAGEAALFEANSPHRHESIGDVPRSNVVLELTCEPQPNAIGNTGLLPGLVPGSGPYQVQVRERMWEPGAQTPVHILSGPTATLVVEGTIARSTASGGVECSGPGRLYVSPVGELAQNTNIGGTTARTLDIDVWPTGEARSVAQPPGVEVPSPFAAGACPPS